MKVVNGISDSSLRLEQKIRIKKMEEKLVIGGSLSAL
jgi:hypothetical protein